MLKNRNFYKKKDNLDMKKRRNIELKLKEECNQELSKTLKYYKMN